MDINTNTMTAWTPSFGMPATGHACLRSYAHGVDLTTVAVAAKGRVAVNERVQRALPGHPAWRPPTS